MTMMRLVNPWYRRLGPPTAVLMFAMSTPGLGLAQAPPTTQPAGQPTTGQPATGQPTPGRGTTQPVPGQGTAAPATPAGGAQPPAGSAPSTLRQPVNKAGTRPPAPQTAAAQAAALPADYVIGPDDELQVVFWQEKDLSAQVIVRPDGKISLPLINDVHAAGLTPAQLRESIMTAASRFVTDPSLTIFTKAINSRKVFVTGEVGKPGPYALNETMTVLQMLANAGGLAEYAKASEIVVMRTEQGQTKSYKFNYKDIIKGKNLQQNIVLKPGDTIIVP